jgi:Helix-turn-helix domain
MKADATRNQLTEVGNYSPGAPVRGGMLVSIRSERAELTPHLARAIEDIRPKMYTEEEVAAMIRVSLSQLRKWRMKGNAKSADGPPFKKIGRMVRYPAKALEAYIDRDGGE